MGWSWKIFFKTLLTPTPPASTYASANCSSCHGSGMMSVGYNWSASDPRAKNYEQCPCVQANRSMAREVGYDPYVQPQQQLISQQPYDPYLAKRQIFLAQRQRLITMCCNSNPCRCGRNEWWD
jgi:hypothetical protein